MSTASRASYQKRHRQVLSNSTVMRKIESMKIPGTKLLAVSIFLFPVCVTADPCFDAYWNNKDVENFAKCKADAFNGEAIAEFGYGLILWSGHDHKTDRIEAVKWCKKSARQGHKMAQIALGKFISQEEAGSEFLNLPEAYAWFRAAGEIEAANHALSRLPDSELQRAKALADE